VQPSLFFSTTDFKIDGHPYERVPLFADPETMRLELIPTRWMYHIAVVSARTRSPATWRIYAYHLRDWLGYASEQSWDWKRPQEDQLAHYRNYLERSEAPHARHVRPEGRRRHRNSVSARMRVICAFYEWAHKHKHLEDPGFIYEAVLNGRVQYSLLAHTQQGRISGRNVLLPRAVAKADYKRYFTKTEQERFFTHLDERDTLIVMWALHTGARLSEVCALQIDQIPEERFYRQYRFFPIQLRVAKGDKLAQLVVPTWLLDDTYRFIRFGGRRNLERTCRQHSHPVSDRIFLGPTGRGLTGNAAYRAFKKALSTSGVHGRFHDLRHTYAINMLDSLMRKAGATKSPQNALLALKRLMRHSSFTSTEVYLEAREIYLTDIFQEDYETPDDRFA
jgi:integrase/recombinase XerD